MFGSTPFTFSGRYTYENRYYVALPYYDVENHHTRPEAPTVIAWFRRTFICDVQSVCKDRWIELRHGNRVCFAQWEETSARGPTETKTAE